MTLRFSKMHGSGNDFVVVDSRDGALALDAASHSRDGRSSHRHRFRSVAERGTCARWRPARFITASGMPTVRRRANAATACAAWRRGCIAPARWPLARQCGSRALRDPVAVRLLGTDQVTVDMGEPIFDPSRIPFDAPQAADRYMLDVNGQPVAIGAVSMGNPHAVVVVDKVPSEAMLQPGTWSDRPRAFPRRRQHRFRGEAGPAASSFICARARRRLDTGLRNRRLCRHGRAASAWRGRRAGAGRSARRQPAYRLGRTGRTPVDDRPGRVCIRRRMVGSITR